PDGGRRRGDPRRARPESRRALRMAMPPQRGSKRSRAPASAGGMSRLGRVLGPGLITGASDDDPSGIGTYSQAGSQFGLGTLWLALFTLPLMVAVQEACARIALQTGVGLGTSLRRTFPSLLVCV